MPILLQREAYRRDILRRDEGRKEGDKEGDKGKLVHFEIGLVVELLAVCEVRETGSCAGARKSIAEKGGKKVD